MFYEGKSVLVTGGTGFVGTHIVQELLKHNARVRVVVHQTRPVINDDRVEIIKGDLTKLDDCLKAVQGVDCIFHAAGPVGAAGVSASDVMSGITLNLMLNAQMLHAAWQENIERFLLFSSSTVYPVTDHPVKEEEIWDGPTHPSYLGYGWMRRYLEKMGEFVVSQSRVKLAIVRPTAVYGPFDNFDLSSCHVIPALIRKAVEKQTPFEVWGSGDEMRDFLHIKDLARGCLIALEKCANCDPVNIGYGKAVTIKETVDVILKAAGHEEAKVVYNNSRPTAIPFRMVDTSKARKQLGFTPEFSLEEGLRETVNWYVENRFNWERQ